MTDDQLRNLFEIDDKKEFTKAALREWKKRHSPKSTGPRCLSALKVYEATATELEALQPRQWETLKWRQLIAKVRRLVPKHSTGKKRRGDRYSKETIRKHVRDYVYRFLYWPEIPPRLLDGRQPWLRRKDKTHATRVEAFYRYKANLPYDAGLLDRGLFEYVTKKPQRKNKLITN